MSHRRGGNRRSKTDGQRRSMDAASVSSVEDTPYVSTLEENSSSSERQSDTIDLTRLGSHRQGSGGMTSDGGISGSGFVDLRQVDSQPLHRPTSSYGGVDIDLSLAVDGTNSSSMPRSSNIIGTNNASHHRTSSSSSTSSAMPEQYLASSLLSSSQQPSPYNKTSATTNQDDNNSSFIDADVVDVSALEKLADGEGVSGRARASSETEAIALGLMSPSGEFGPSPCREDVVRALTAESQFPLDQGDHLIGGDWVKVRAKYHHQHLQPHLHHRHQHHQYYDCGLVRDAGSLFCRVVDLLCMNHLNYLLHNIVFLIRTPYRPCIVF